MLKLAWSSVAAVLNLDWIDTVRIARLYCIVMFATLFQVRPLLFLSNILNSNFPLSFSLLQVPPCFFGLHCGALVLGSRQ